MKSKPTKKPISQIKLLPTIVKVLGRLTKYQPNTGATLESVIAGVIKELGYDDPSKVPFRVEGKRPNLKRNVYLVLWNLAVERRQGQFWTVRRDATSQTAFHLPTTKSQGKGAVGNKKPTKTNPQQAFLWSLTWFGIHQSLQMRDGEKENITGIYLGKKLKVPGVMNTITHVVVRRCPISANMMAEQDHVQGKLLNFIMHDGLQKQLLKNMGYGANISPSQLGAFAARFAYSEVRGWATDAGMRAMCGATTETERKKQAAAIQAAEENPEEMGLPVFPTIRPTVDCGSQSVNPVVLTGADDLHSSVSREFVDSSTASSEDQVIYEDAMGRIVNILSERFQSDSPRYVKAMTYMIAGDSVTEIATKMEISLYQARGMIDRMRETIKQEYLMEA